MTDLKQLKTITLKVSRAYSVGDVHENLSSIRYFIENYDIRDCVLFFCGDNGMGFMSDLMMCRLFAELDALCKEYNVYLVLVRGNHDNPQYYVNGGPFPEFDNILLVSDYTVVILEHPDGYSVNILCVGGAASIDRERRVRDHQRDVAKFIKYHPDSGLTREEVEARIPLDFWEDELPVYDDEKLAVIKTLGIDHIITHTAPSFCPKSPETIPGWVCEYDKSRARMEREVMDQLYQWVLNENTGVLKSWFYGHFHEHNVTDVNGITFYGLDQFRYGKFDVKEIPFI